MFAIDILNDQEEIKSKYSIFYQDFSIEIGLPKLHAFNGTEEDSTFQSLFLDYHRTAIMFVQCRMIPAQIFDSSKFIFTIESLDDISKQVYQLLTDHIYQYAKGSISRNAGFFIGFPICDIFFAVVFGLILDFFIMNYMRKIFSIVRTIQPPALKTISVQFDRLLKFQEHHIPKIKANPFYHPILYYVICMISFFILPIFFCLKAVNERKVENKYDVKPLPPLPSIDSSINYMYYTFAVIEYLIKINSTLIPYYNDTIVELAFGPDSICVHYLFTTLADVNEFRYEFYENMKNSGIILVSAITVVIGALSLLIVLI